MMRAQSKSRGTRRRGRMLAPGLAALLLVGACATDAEPENDADAGARANANGVPVGASKQEYIAAFADVDPIKVVIPTPGAKGVLTSESPEKYAQALEKWSGGKLSVEIGYGNSVASIPETGAALVDGRAQFGMHVPIYEPDAFPATNAVMDLMFMAKVSPLVGLLQQYAAALEVAWETEEIITELTDAGFAPIVAIGGGSPGVGLLCGDLAPVTLEQMKGLQARVSGRAHVAPLEALGITPVSLTITEIYEGLQRGVIDCGEMLLGTAHATGALEVAKFFSIGEDVGFPATPVTHSASLAFWEKLPLVARQLMWDRMDVYLEAFIVTTIRSEVDAVTTLRDSGGVVKNWEPEVVEALKAQNAKTLDAAREGMPPIKDSAALVDRMEDTYDKWLKIITEELGYSDDGSLFDLPVWYSEEEVDFSPFVERLMSDVMESHRPS